MFYLQWNLPTTRYGVFDPDTWNVTWSIHKEKATRIHQNAAEAWVKAFRTEDIVMKYEVTHA
jgi:hypothetical protein